ncbi:MAG: hypothetical protein Q7R30_21730 [Acidobacteriota bacterium]|nr:hypothetical protein [Acidobacteriota bacterium]
MLLPNADAAVIEPAKLHGYLLSREHPIGRFKARFFTALGFSAAQWDELETAFRLQHLTRDATPAESGPHGQAYEIRAILKGPGGSSAPVVSVWFVRVGEQYPRFVTAYPGGPE